MPLQSASVSGSVAFSKSSSSSSDSQMQSSSSSESQSQMSSVGSSQSLTCTSSQTTSQTSSTSPLPPSIAPLAPFSDPQALKVVASLVLGLDSRPNVTALVDLAVLLTPVALASMQVRSSRRCESLYPFLLVLHNSITSYIYT